MDPASWQAHPARRPSASHGDPLNRPGHCRPADPHLGSAAGGAGRPHTAPSPRPARPPRRIPLPAAITVPTRPAGRAALDFETGQRHRAPVLLSPKPGPTRLPHCRQDSPRLTGATGRTHRARSPELTRPTTGPATYTAGEPQPRRTAPASWLTGGRQRSLAQQSAVQKPAAAAKARAQRRPHRRLLTWAGGQTDGQTPTGCGNADAAPRTKMAARSVSAAHVSAAPHKDGGARLSPCLSRPSADGCPV